MRFDLAALARRTKNPRRKAITFRDIVPPAVLSTDLYRACYAPVIAFWVTRADRLLAEYERSLSGLTTDSALDLDSILAAIGDEFSRLFLSLTPRLRDWAVRVEGYQRQRWIGAALTASGVDLTTLLTFGDVAETVEQTIAWNTSLIRDVSDVTRARVGNAVFDGLKNRTPAREMARTIREAVGMSKRRAMNVAVDQLQKLSADLSDARREQAGLSVWEWRHGEKLRPRKWHVERNGNLYSADPAMIGKVVDGKTVMQEPERSDLPSRPPWCSCRSLATLVFD